MKQFLKQYRVLILVVIALVGWSVFFYLVPADVLISWIGINNAYLFAFLISGVAGFSAFTGTTAYAAVIELSRGGADPLYLGLSGGIGLFLSDSFFYVLAIRGRSSIATRFRKFFNYAQRTLQRVPDVFVYFGVFLFAAFGPIPNDVIMAALVVSGYNYRRFWPFL